MFEHRKLNNESYDKIANALSTIDWSSINSYHAEDIYNTIIRKINDIIDLYAPKQITKIPAKHVMREP